MSVDALPSHVALLVPSVTRAAEVFARAGFAIGEAQEFVSEGTREIYVEQGRAQALLLMEPLAQGPYRRALEKRGPGLHHLAIDVASLEDFAAAISGSGWLLHPASLAMMKSSRTIYLSRPGFPGLIEVQEREPVARSGRATPNTFVDTVRFPSSSVSSVDFDRLIEAIGLSKHVVVGSEKLSLTIQGREFDFKELL